MSRVRRVCGDVALIAVVLIGWSGESEGGNGKASGRAMLNPLPVAVRDYALAA